MTEYSASYAIGGASLVLLLSASTNGAYRERGRERERNSRRERLAAIELLSQPEMTTAEFIDQVF